MEIEQQTQQIQNEMNLESLKTIIQKYQNDNTTDIDTAILTIQKVSQLYRQRKKLHQIICSAFSSRFPELKLIVPDFENYARVAKFLANHDKIEETEICNYLTQQQIVSLSLGLTTNLGPEITNPSFFAACDLQIVSSEISNELSNISTTVASHFAPNLCALVGSEKAAHLISYAGGLRQLSCTPACDIKMFGSKKVGLQGFSSRSTNNYQGILYKCEVVQDTTPEFRDSVFRDLCNKVALVSRVDASGNYADGSYGEQVKMKLTSRLDKKMNNKTPKYIRPLPVPGLENKKTRGGRQKRANKKKFGIGEELTNRQKVAFGIGGQFDEIGVQYGKTALESFRKTKANVDGAFQQKIDKKLKAMDKAHK
ncbi:Nop domain-containing protein [Histomonas meleagridis]|uniref:Nop domain-containing protein n=1 Tax=Histomonas meleagridis TaxID=135588 RepID=UPI00355A23D3|nr:Nop domain-containing protein [Histomonas meleagridis]KAH0800861.1 Nop domain-containing protein [Histomonas meleagridis]